MPSSKMFYSFVAIVLLFPSLSYAQWESDIVFEKDGKLIYVAVEGDVENGPGNRIPDFSYAGYKNSEQPIPNWPVGITLYPDADKHDDAIRINEAIDNAEYKNAVLLKAGEYEVYTTIRLDRDGVVLRGEGDNADPSANTIIKAYGYRSPEKMGLGILDEWIVLTIGGGGYGNWQYKPSGNNMSQSNIIDDFVQVGSRNFTVYNASSYRVGQTIVIVHPCSNAWIDAIQPKIGSVKWSCENVYSDSFDILYLREIVYINNNDITINAPIFNDLDKELTQSYMYQYNWNESNIVNNTGLEAIRIDIQFDETEKVLQTHGHDHDHFHYIDEDHAKTAVLLKQVQDAWIRDCTLLHFSNGINSREATRITIENVTAIEPVARIKGGRRYNLGVGGWTQQVLFKDNFASQGRHNYIINGGETASGIVFLHNTSQLIHTIDESHRRWSQGILFDNHKVIHPADPQQLGLYRHSGSVHGWTSAHSVMWNTTLNSDYHGIPDIIIGNPPTAQNYAIGFNKVNIRCSSSENDHPCNLGYVEDKSGMVKPQSLYESQLKHRQ